MYRAVDTTLNREVAIKVLPANLADDGQYMMRFRREAQTLAALNHPNIAAVYGIEQTAIIMELVDGVNPRGPMPVDQVIPIARQLAEGLEAAHERGIVHRDLKPAKIKITRSGVVKILDFGLAKSTRDSGAAPQSMGTTQSPTLSLDMTQAGAILGTAAYMSPEQARGKDVDARSDIWAFGVVLYEMLLGRRPFGGETVADLLASVVKDDPDLDALPASTPAHIRRLIERCLRKDVKMRLQAIGDARIAIDEPLEITRGDRLPIGKGRPPHWFAWIVATGAILAGGVGWWRSMRPVERAQTIKLSVPAPAHGIFDPSSRPSVSPDGRHIAYAAASEGKGQLWVRDLDQLQSRPIAGTEDARDPFWSPDSRFVAFFAAGKLKRVGIEGGPALTVCVTSRNRGGSWSRNDVILFSPSTSAGLSSVPAAGGSPVRLTTLAAGETSHRFPWFLPDGRHYLYTARSGTADTSAIYVGDLDSKDRQLLISDASNGTYSAPGFILFTPVKRAQEPALMAQAFDAAKLNITGTPALVAEHVDFIATQIQGQFAVSQTGILAYYEEGGRSNRSQLTWIDRGGKILGTIGPVGEITSPVISPSGTSVAVDRLDPVTGTPDIWLDDEIHQTESRLTFDPKTDTAPVWSPDGKQIIFASNRAGPFGLYLKSASGAGKEELLHESANPAFPTDWSRDGRMLIFDRVGTDSGFDIWMLPTSGDKKAIPFLQTKSWERHGKLSPDGRWLAYESDESGRLEVYVTAFPGKEGKWQLSTGGASRPVWSRDGRQIFFISESGQMMEMALHQGVTFEPSVPQNMFLARTPSNVSFDVSRDGSRFLVANLLDQGATHPMTVVINWSAGLMK